MEKKSKGLGDSLEKIFKVTGIKSVVEKTTDILGIENCGCTRRKNVLNELFPYSQPNIQQPKNNTELLVEGTYYINNNLVITRNGEIFNYKIGDKILLEKSNPNFNDFQVYYNLGLITKE